MRDDLFEVISAKTEPNLDILLTSRVDSKRHLVMFEFVTT